METLKEFRAENYTISYVSDNTLAILNNLGPWGSLFKNGEIGCWILNITAA